MNLPTNLPILSGGKQAPGSGQVCAEQAINWLVSGRLDLGDETDHPDCVQPTINALAITVNDRMSDAGRHAMWPLILRQPGTARPELEPHLSVQLATFLAIEANEECSRPRPTNDEERDANLIRLLSVTQDYLEDLIGTCEECAVDVARIDRLAQLVGNAG